MAKYIFVTFIIKSKQFINGEFSKKKYVSFA